MLTFHFKRSFPFEEGEARVNYADPGGLEFCAHNIPFSLFHNKPEQIKQEQIRHLSIWATNLAFANVVLGFEPQNLNLMSVMIDDYNQG